MSSSQKWWSCSRSACRLVLAVFLSGLCGSRSFLAPAGPPRAVRALRATTEKPTSPVPPPPSTSGAALPPILGADCGDAVGMADANLSRDEWDGQMEGFDWHLEMARRALDPHGVGFTPFRMSYWKPPSALDEQFVVSIWDTLAIGVGNILQKFGFPSMDGAPVAKIGLYKGSPLVFLQGVLSGKLEELAGGPLFLKLYEYFQINGPIYKLAFGPRSFIVVSDPVMAKYLLKSNVQHYDKGVLASILEPIMGKGLIPADPETWKVRRRAIVPGFHKRWLDRMMRLFAECNGPLLQELSRATADGDVIDMEEKFCSVSLDIIGRAVFNYDFGSVTTESPIIKAVYRVLKEAEHRSSSFIPYWKIPFAETLLASQAEFAKDMRLLNSVLDDLIAKAIATQQVADVDELETRDLDMADDPSLLRFLIDMRGEDTTSLQLRDDLMTMLIAGHETTAAVLTWTLFNLAQNPELTKEIQDEIESVIGRSRLPVFDDMQGLVLTRYALVEALRLYPEPPVLIRRALTADVLPKGGGEAPVTLPKGTDVFISTWNLHRSPALWDEPEVYNPKRFFKKFENAQVEGWAGFDPSRASGLYPNEITSDFAFLPFGGGNRKCIGDQFAMMEAVVTLVLILRDFNADLAVPAEDVGMVTGATIHTANGLPMRISRRHKPQ